MGTILKKYSVRVSIFALCLCAALPTLAQKTQSYSQTEEIFYHAVELYNKKLFGSSIQEFDRFVRASNTRDLLYEQAELYILINHLHLNHNAADKKLAQFLKYQPQSGLQNLALLELGNYFFRNNKFRKAADQYENLNISNLPTELWEEANFKMGYSFFKDHDFVKAKENFNKLRNTQGEYYVESNYFYGYMCYKDMDFTCALNSFKRIDGQGPEITNLYIAQIYYAQGGFMQALDQCKASIATEHQDEYNLLRGKCHFQLKEMKQAYEYFSNISIDSRLLTDEDVYMIGYSNFLNKEYANASAAFVKISGLESGLGQLANYQLGQSFIALNDKQSAYNALGVAKRMSHSAEIKEVASFNYAKLAFEQGAQNTAIQATQEFIDDYPNSEYADEARGNLVNLLASTSNEAQAIKILDEIKIFDATRKSIYQRLTYAWAEKKYLDKSYQEATILFEKSLRFTPDKKLEAQSYYWMGELSYIDENYEGAVQNFNRMMSVTGAKSSRYYNQLYYNLGYVHYNQKDYSKAIAYFKQYYENTSNNKEQEIYIDNALRLGDCYFLKSNYAAASEMYSFVGNGGYKESDYAIFQQGIILGLMGKPREKISVLKNIQTKYRDSKLVDDAIFEIANTHLQDLNDPAMALSIFNFLTSRFSESIYCRTAYVKMALIFDMEGDYPKALSYCKKVIETYPQTESAQEAMATGEAVSVKMNKVDEWIEYLGGVPGGNIRVTYQDSLLYESAVQKYRIGDCTGALKGFTDYKKRFSEAGFFLPHAHYYSGLCHFNNNETYKAIENFEYVSKLSSTDFTEDVNLKLAQIFYDQGKYTDALPYYSKLEKIATTQNNFVVALLGQMRCNYTLGNYEAAKNNATAILPVNTEIYNQIEANFILGQIQHNAKNYYSAMIHFNYVVENSQTEKGAQAEYLRCLIMYQQGNLADSKEEIFVLGDQYASYEYWVVKSFILLGYIYTDEEDFFSARATLQTTLDLYDKDQALIDEINAQLKKIDALEQAKKKGIKP